MNNSKLVKWEILEEEDLSSSKWFPLFKQKIKTGRGEIVEDFYLSRLGKIAIILPVLRSKEIVFIRQYRHAAGEIMYELPAGMVDNDSSVEDVAIRELEEETGIRISKEQLKPLDKTIPVPHKLEMTVYGFLVNDLEFNAEQKLEPDEDIEVVTLKQEKVWQMIKDGEIFQSDTIAFLTRARLLYPEIIHD